MTQTRETPAVRVLAASVVALAALATAAPAMSQPGGYDDRYEHRGRSAYSPWNNDYGPDRARQADRRIDAGLRSGRLTSRESWRLREDLRDVVRFELRLRRNGLTWHEREALDRRWDGLMAEIRDQSRDRQHRHDRDYGYGYGWRR